MKLIEKLMWFIFIITIISLYFIYKIGLYKNIFVSKKEKYAYKKENFSNINIKYDSLQKILDSIKIEKERLSTLKYNYNVNLTKYSQLKKTIKDLKK